MLSKDKIEKLRTAITESLRVQRGGAKPIPYIDVGNTLNDVNTRHNHAVFARRGCGKTLLLDSSTEKLGKASKEIKTVYLNCEDFKRHSFPNILTEILDALFSELDKQSLSFWQRKYLWFGRRRKCHSAIKKIREDLTAMRAHADERETDVKEASSVGRQDSSGGSMGAKHSGVKAEISEKVSKSWKEERELKYKHNYSKLQYLDTWLPRLKAQITEFFQYSTTTKAVFLQIDDFYFLNRSDQPFIMDYVHRLCKGVPLFFKVATLRHVSTLYAERDGQPIGIQERHDYQSIDIDFTLANLSNTTTQNQKIFYEIAKRAGITPTEIDALFKGEGFQRLVLAGGGVPRDCLSLFLEVLESVQPPNGDGRIGKDDVRILSRSNLERRIEELKKDSEGEDPTLLLQGIYVLRQFCLDQKSSIVMVSEALIQQDDFVRDLLYRLLDYRILHSAGTALTHKSKAGNYHAFAIDIGSYAHIRTLVGKINEIDLGANDAKEQMRSAPVLDEAVFQRLWKDAPAQPEAALKLQEQVDNAIEATSLSPGS